MKTLRAPLFPARKKCCGSTALARWPAYAQRLMQVAYWHESRSEAACRLTILRPSTFADAFAAQFQCSSADFKPAAFRRCLYRRAWLLAWLLPRRFFEADWVLLDAAASATSVEQVVQTIRNFCRLQAGGETIRHRLKLRLSGRKLIALATQLLPARHAQPFRLSSISRL